MTGPPEDMEYPIISFLSAGYVDDYSDQKMEKRLDLDSLNADLRAFVDNYKLEHPESEWAKLQRLAEEEIQRWGE